MACSEPQRSALIEDDPVPVMHAATGLLGHPAVLPGVRSYLSRAKKVADELSLSSNKEMAKRVVNGRAAARPARYPIHNNGVACREREELLRQSVGAALASVTADGLFANVDLRIGYLAEALRDTTCTEGLLPHLLEEQEGMGALTVSLTSLEGEPTLRRLTKIGRFPDSLARAHRRIDNASQECAGYSFITPKERDTYRMLGIYPLRRDVLAYVVHPTGAVPPFVQKHTLAAVRRVASEVPLNRIRYDMSVVCRTISSPEDDRTVSADLAEIVLADAGEGNTDHEAHLVAHSLKYGGMESSALSILTRTASMVGIDLNEPRLYEQCASMLGVAVRGCVFPWLEGAAQVAREQIARAAAVAPAEHGLEQHSRAVMRAALTSFPFHASSGGCALRLSRSELLRGQQPLMAAIPEDSVLLLTLAGGEGDHQRVEEKSSAENEPVIVNLQTIRGRSTSACRDHRTHDGEPYRNVRGPGRVRPTGRPLGAEEAGGRGAEEAQKTWRKGARESENMSPREGRAHFWGKREGEKRRKSDLLAPDCAPSFG